MKKDDLVAQLLLLDEEASLLFEDSGLRFSIVIVGGSSLLLMGYSLRTTHDIDVLSSPAKLLPLFARYGLNTAVTAYMDCFPYGYESRLKRLPIQGKIIDFYAPSLEDIVVSKLYALRPPDLADLESQEVLVALDWRLLDKLVHDREEAQASALNERRYQEMVTGYEDYKRKFWNEKTNV